MHNGFLRVAAAVPCVNVADVDFNVDRTVEAVEALASERVELAVFPECGLTGYTCADLFHNRALIEAAAAGLQRLREVSRQYPGVAIVVGLPVEAPGVVYNCAALLRAGEVDLIGKSYVPDYNEFYERRWWAPFPAVGEVETPLGVITSGRTFEWAGTRIGVELCEDLWVPQPPSGVMAMRGAEVICNLSASDDLIGKYAYIKELVRQQSARCICAYIYAGAGWGESSTDLVFDGKAMVAENGALMAVGARWQRSGSQAVADIDIEAIRRDRLHLTTFSDCTDRCGISRDPLPAPESGDGGGSSDLKYRTVDPHPFVPADDACMDERCDEIVHIQTAGLARRLDFMKCRAVTVGISGGLDSTLALLVAHRTFTMLGLDPKGITGVTMPGFGTTGRTHRNACRLMELLGVTIREISIVPAVMQHFSDIGHDPEMHDVTYENSQARQRTLLLMDIANQTGGIVIGTGDLSELALGWATYNGDHMSMYGVNAGVPKTLVRWLVRWFAMQSEGELRSVLLDILDTPVSPELLPAAADGTIDQRTEDLVGPYELHDFFLYYTLRYGFSRERIRMLARRAFSPDEYTDEVIDRWLDTFFRRFFAQQFKRSCLPDGPKVGSVCLSPRGDWRMPSDAASALWRR